MPGMKLCRCPALIGGVHLVPRDKHRLKRCTTTQHEASREGIKHKIMEWQLLARLLPGSNQSSQHSMKQGETTGQLSIGGTHWQEYACASCCILSHTYEAHRHQCTHGRPREHNQQD